RKSALRLGRRRRPDCARRGVRADRRLGPDGPRSSHRSGSRRRDARLADRFRDRALTPNWDGLADGVAARLLELSVRAPHGKLRHQVGADLRAAERADGEADGAAQSLVEVGQAFVEIDIPAPFAPYERLPRQDRGRRTCVRTDAAMDTEVVSPEGLGRIGYEWGVGQHAG